MLTSAALQRDARLEGDFDRSSRDAVCSVPVAHSHESCGEGSASGVSQEARLQPRSGPEGQPSAHVGICSVPEGSNKLSAGSVSGVHTCSNHWLEIRRKMQKH